MLPAARRRAAGTAATAWLVALATFAAGAPAATPVQLGHAGAFAVLGASTVTSAGTSTITGDLGVSPGTSVTGFPPGAGTGVLNGTVHAGDSVAAAAHADLATAYAASVLVPKTADATVLDGLTLNPGVHRGATLELAGTLTLNGGGDPNAVFIFQAGTTLTTAALSQVSLTNGTQACNVFWQVGSSATLGAGTLLRGSILADQSITVGAGTTIDGRALAVNAAVTLDNDTITVRHCAGDPALTLGPVFGDFSATLTGSAQNTHTTVSDWNVSDPSAGARGWEVTMSATPFVTAGLEPITMTGATLTVAAPAATPVELTNSSTAPAVFGGNIRAGSVKVADAATGTGLRAWRLSQGASDLTLGIPPDARAGSYTSTITTTLSPGI